MAEIHSVEIDPEQKRRLWKAHIERWQQSGLSQLAYCRKHELKAHQFTYWKKSIVRTDTDISFIPLQLSHNLPMTVKASTVTLFTPNGYRIEVGASFDPTAFKQLISIVKTL